MSTTMSDWFKNARTERTARAAMPNSDGCSGGSLVQGGDILALQAVVRVALGTLTANTGAVPRLQPSIKPMSTKIIPPSFNSFHA
jgi:hypothetical protein